MERDGLVRCQFCGELFHMELLANPMQNGSSYDGSTGKYFCSRQCKFYERQRTQPPIQLGFRAFMSE